MTPPPALSCARCGYDLSGTADAWDDRCPLRGICPECGHGFLWADAFDPARNDVEWLVEHARSWRQYIRRFFPTLMRMMLARPYWRAVGVDTRVGRWRLALLVLLVLGVPHLAGAIPVGITSYQRWTDPWVMSFYGKPSFWELARGITVNGITYPVARSWVPQLTSWHIDPILDGTLMGTFGASLAWPLTMVALPVTRRRAKLRAPHIVRAWIGGSLALCPAWLAQIALRTIPVDLGVLVAGSAWIWLGSFAWLTWWWWSAITTGWRVERGRTIAVLLTVVSYLAGASCGALHAVWFP